MKASITQFFTLPDYKLPISTELKSLLRMQIDEHILAKYSFAQVKAKILEIWIDTAPDIDTLKITKMSKTDKGKYLSFTFLFPYDILMKDPTLWLSPFIDLLFNGLSQIFAPYNIPQMEIDNLKEAIKQEVINNEAYLKKVNPKLELIKDIIKNAKIPQQEKVHL